MIRQFAINKPQPQPNGRVAAVSVIESWFKAGDGLCAVVLGNVVGFAVFQMLGKGAVHIIEARPGLRHQKVGLQVLWLQSVSSALVKRISGRWMHIQRGEALCRSQRTNAIRQSKAPPLLVRVAASKPLWY